MRSEFTSAVIALACIGASGTARAAAPQCTNTVTAKVAAIDQPLMFNRFGAGEPGGMMFALLRDVVSTDGGSTLTPGKVMLRPGKRPRPLVLRVNEGDCLRIEFTSLLYSPQPGRALPSYFGSPNGTVSALPGAQGALPIPPLTTLTASATVVGLDLVNTISSDGTFAGANPNALAASGGTTVTYTYYGAKEGTYLLQSSSALFDYKDPSTAGQRMKGLFGAVIVEPKGSEWYRSQVTAQELLLAKTGSTSLNQPLLNYSARYPSDTIRSDGTTIPKGTPVLRMLDSNNEIVYSDLNAIISGPNGGRLAVAYPPNPVLPDRQQPFREFTVIYHEDRDAVQAYPAFNDQNTAKGGLGPVLSNGSDTFAINYGAAGVATEVYANRIRKGPAKDCVECKFEEFFLSSWPLGDPAMIVDNPANSGAVATQALFPDDPSNVHHSYLNDHVRYRVLHAGINFYHVHHLHAHQWLYDADSDTSAFLDSQALGPGATFTQEIAYNGSGNQNRTVGDSIFHCHFYTHFAGGMWELWRVHDVYELGTALDGQGRPVPGGRALPDGEITRGTPIPAIIPLPGLPLPLVPAMVSLSPDGKTVGTVTGTGNPGYPFFVPGLAGHRPPHPPMDFALDEKGQPLNGGLPRHIVTGGQVGQEAHTPRDFTKESALLTAQELPEQGTNLEQRAMKFHSEAQRTFTPSSSTGGTGIASLFQTNGQAPQQGAPYADPCPPSASRKIVYKGANIQLDLTFNKKGWHMPQGRILTLWEDALPALQGSRAPEPMFIRANSGDCIEYWHTNLVPSTYRVDDFQVTTPTDIIGQHIHLVKFDVTSADGAANGWNYEDGAFSPDEVRERIVAINKAGGLNGNANPKLLTPLPPPKVFGNDPAFVGAQTTLQRWYADPILDNAGNDRTLRTVFTHDHFGPSTHQQAGLYGGLLVEPAGSQWLNVTSGQAFGNSPGASTQAKRDDGGPTSFQAYIQPSRAGAFEPYREFALEYQDLQLGYRKGTPSSTTALTPPPSEQCGATGQAISRPCPQLISSTRVGAATINYRSEPLLYRTNPVQGGPQVAGNTDLSHVFQSMPRQDTELNTLGPFPMAGASPYDPYTPLLRAYEGEKVQMRVLVGAQLTPQHLGVQGLKWRFQPSEVNSGYRSSQTLGISEHFELEFKMPQGAAATATGATDYLYTGTMADPWITQGPWGLLRAYASQQTAATGGALQPVPASLSTTPKPAAPDCPAEAPLRLYNVSAVSARQVLGSQQLVYYQRALDKSGTTDIVSDPDALLYVRSEDLEEAQGKLSLKLLPGRKPEPLVLRANAGDCIQVTLSNRLPANFSFKNGDIQKGLSNLGNFGTITMPFPSLEVGLHPQLVDYNSSQSNGFNVGINPVQTVAPGGAPKTYRWYAGSLDTGASGQVVGTPMELGASNLVASDPLGQPEHGLAAALVIEPAGSTWQEDPNTALSATVTPGSGSAFREFVIIEQQNLNLSNPATKNNVFAALNYGTEPITNRYGASTVVPPDLSCAFSNQLAWTAEPVGDPQTFVFSAPAGMPARFRVLHSGPSGDAVITLTGHSWQEEPYTQSSTRMGDNPKSRVTTSRAGFGPGGHFDMVVQAGGAQAIPGDYLFTDYPAQNLSSGTWGIFRVTPKNTDTLTFTSQQTQSGANTILRLAGNVTLGPSGQFASAVEVFGGSTPTSADPCGTQSPTRTVANVPVDRTTGQWSANLSFPSKSPFLCVRSTNGALKPLSSQTPPPTACFKPTEKVSTLRKIETPRAERPAFKEFYSRQQADEENVVRLKKRQNAPRTK
ncbi:copper oxidase [Hyalangium versicolor]|uniref:copper oxidase n=1 Tax=Hyalangium versicolor TaxID=2861190 RepID=UPI001CCE8A00|nr:copper oxidase [Hyalangium versicolor]